MKRFLKKAKRLLKVTKALIKNISNKKAPQSGAFLFLNFLFFSFRKEPGEIHNEPNDRKKGRKTDEIKFVSENGSKNFKNRVSGGSVKEEKVYVKNFVEEINRNGFAKKKQKHLRKPSEIRFETACNKKKRIHNEKNVDGI